MALDPSTLALLKNNLKAKFVPHLPQLSDLTRPQEEQERKNVSRALSAFVLHHICDVSEETAAKAVVDDFGDGGIDAILFHGDIVYIVQSKLKESELFKQEEAQAFCAGVRNIIRLNFAGFNVHVKRRQTELEDSISNCSKIQLVIAHVGSGMSGPARDAINQLLQDESADEERIISPYLDIDHQKIKAFIQNGNSYPRVDATLHLECNKSISSPRKAYFGLIHLEALVDLHMRYEKGLYVKNIRTFLGMGLKQGVNEAIQQTLQDDPENFCYLNNGVTALCDFIDPKVSTTARKTFKVKGLSVINGAQTISASAHVKSKGIDISKARVMLTLIAGDSNSEFGKSVTKARNHQNPVSLSDFVALEEDQERLRKEAAYLGIHYDYKPGMWDQSDPTKININEAAAALAICHNDPRYAVWLKKEPGTLYDTKNEKYKGLFPASLSVHGLINAVLFYRYMQGQTNTQVNATAGLERLTYKHGFYALAWVLSKKLKAHIFASSLLQINDLQTAMSIPFDEARNKLLHLTGEQQRLGRGPLAVYRNQTHAIPLLEQLMLQDYGLTHDLAIPHKRTERVANDLYPVALFNYMISKAPQIKVGP